MYHFKKITSLMFHSKAAMGYVPVVHNRQNLVQNNDINTKHAILSSRDIKSLVMSALIFLSVFAWADVLASIYRVYYLGQNAPKYAGMLPLKLPHHVPENMKPRTLEDLDTRAKIAYALLLSGATCIITLALNSTKK